MTSGAVVPKPRIHRHRIVFGKREYLGWRCVGGGCVGFAVDPLRAYREWLGQVLDREVRR